MAPPLYPPPTRLKSVLVMGSTARPGASRYPWGGWGAPAFVVGAARSLDQPPPASGRATRRGERLTRRGRATARRSTGAETPRAGGDVMGSTAGAPPYGTGEGAGGS